MTIIIKTKMTKLPESCRECDYRVITNGAILCGVIKDFMSVEEYRNGRTKFENCPLEYRGEQ